MHNVNSPAPVKSKILSIRRLAILASVAGLGITMVAADALTNNGLALASLAPPAQAADAVQPGFGFADLVAKVKPAVISVRVENRRVGQCQRHKAERERCPSSSRLEEILPAVRNARNAERHAAR